MSLEQYKKKVTSQWGEDGIIQEIFRRIGIGNKLCVEIGAWDGKHLSNTWNLWHNEGWSAVLVEGDSKKVKGLEKIVQQFTKVIPYCAFVRKFGKDSIDSILEIKIRDKKIDLMSIDIDGDDYYLFQSIEKYLPRVLVIEYNPTVPAAMSLVQAEGESFGASARALCDLAKQKGYALVAITPTNLFFVINTEFGKLHMEAPRLEEIFKPDFVVNMFVSFDGRAVVTSYPNLFMVKPRHSSSIEFSSPNNFVPVRVSIIQSLFESIQRKLRMRRKYLEQH
ncbi:MAG: hypothetical protein WC764_01450 [Candidatus Paceibacterota bacterium]|jgi:hypothetical protein